MKMEKDAKKCLYVYKSIYIIYKLRNTLGNFYREEVRSKKMGGRKKERKKERKN